MSLAAVQSSQPIKSTKLNLGCGQFPKEGYHNIDIDSKSGADQLVNLDQFPYPLPDNYFELIEADHLFEHLSNPYDVMKEMHRLLKPGGVLKMKVPHFSRAMTHWDHKRGFDVTFPYYFDPTFKGGYTGVEFKCLKSRMTWFSQPYLKKSVLSPFQYYLGLLGGKVIDFFGNLSPFFCTRVWCFWVGGFEEVEFHFQKKSG